MAKDQLFYVGQKAFIDKNGKLLVLFDPQLGLDLPGGKLKEGELDFKESIKREIREETDLEIEVGDPFYSWYFECPKNHRNSGKKIYTIGFKCLYISGKVKLSSEHNRYEWVDKNNYQKLKIKRNVFKAIEKYFSQI